MSRMPRTTRRRFLATTGLAGLAAIPSWVGVGAVRDALWPLPLERRLETLFRDPASARRIGAAYLRSHPEVARAALLADLDGLHGRGETLRRQVREACRADFEAGRIVRVDGWILASTEARVCAILATSA